MLRCRRTSKSRTQGESQPSRRRQIARASLGVVAVGLSIFAIISKWDSFGADLRQVGLLRAVVSAPLLSAGLFAGMLSWRRVLAGLGSPLDLPAASRIYFVGQLGKYLPGSVWPMLAQMELGRDHAIPRRRSITALVIAIIISLATGLTMAGLTVPLLPAHYRHELWWLLLPVPFLALLLHPRILWGCLRRVPRLRLVDGLGQPPAVKTMLAASGWSLLGWFAYGVHVAILAEVFRPSSPATLLAVSVGGYALAWCAGFVVVILPAGAGARDLALAAALSAVIPAGPALAVAVISRIVTTACDLGCAGLALGTSRRTLRTHPAASDVEDAGLPPVAV
jgi:hypothetical protein